MNNQDSQTILNNQSFNKLNSTLTKSQSIIIEETILRDKIISPLNAQRQNVFELEKDLYECLNLRWDIDIITEDIPIILETREEYYMHLLRTANPCPNKENFLLIHGFLSSNLHFISILPYLVKRYNIFIPDTIGMGLSARPQIKFTSPKQCEDYFIGIYHLFIKKLFFSGRFNIKKEYYLCGHSLGGFIASRYMLIYPEGIKKVLLLSPAGITDYSIPGTDFFRDTPKAVCMGIICCTPFVWPCELRVQSLYNCCCCHNIVSKFYGTMGVEIYEEECRKNEDGSDFKVDYTKLKDKIRSLCILTLDYPRDLYKCAYYVFAAPPPAAYLPAEKLIQYYNKKQVIICFGENDWMDRVGAYRLMKFDPDKYKVFTVSKGGHSFANENPKELCSIIEQYFND